MSRSNTATAIPVTSAIVRPYDGLLQVEFSDAHLSAFVPGEDVTIQRPGHRLPERGRVVNQFEIERAQMYRSQSVVVGVEVAVIRLNTADRRP